MKKGVFLVALFLACLTVATAALAQDTGEVVGVEVPPPQSGGFMTVVLAGGLLGILNWAGIFLWAAAALPLGITSIFQCATCRVRQFPLTTKIMMIASAWLFVLAWVGFAQGTISAFSQLSRGAADVGLLALNISQAVFSVSGALAVCQFYLLFLLISVVVVHFRHRTMLQAPPLPPSR